MPGHTQLLGSLASSRPGPTVMVSLIRADDWGQQLRKHCCEPSGQSRMDATLKTGHGKRHADDCS